MSLSRRRRGSRRPRTVLFILGFSACLVSLGLWSEQPDAPESSVGLTPSLPPKTLAFSDSWLPVLDQLRTASQLEPNLVGPYGSPNGLEQFAAQAAIAAFIVTGDPSELMIDLAGRPRMADRVAIGLERLGIGFSRSVEPDSFGFYGTHITLSSHEAELLDSPAYSEAARARLATMVELGGSVEGRLAASSGAAQMQLLADEIGLATTGVDGELWIADLEAVHVLADLHYVDPSNVPVLGGDDRASDLSTEPASVGTDPGGWRVGVTGELPGAIGPEWTGLLPDGNSPIGWTNAEAQAYQAQNVNFEQGRIQIVTLPAEVAGVKNLPFTSGMVVSQESFGWGTTALDIELPAEAGLWPAIWLLDSEACSAPGICSGYNTDTYHEIDLLETRTQEPNVANMSVHWGETGGGVTRSSSASAVMGLEQIGIVIHLERRPGLLVWRINDRVVHVLGGHVSGFDTGPHRNMPMRLVINTAVGGTFAGGELIGRDGGWWGDARAPAEFGELDWTGSEFVIHSVSHIPLG